MNASDTMQEVKNYYSPDTATILVFYLIVSIACLAIGEMVLAIGGFVFSAYVVKCMYDNEQRWRGSN